MSVEEAKTFLPESESPLDAFNVVSQQHFLHLDNLEDHDPKILAKVTSDFLFAGLSYFANNGYDQDLQEVGSVAWWWVRKGIVSINITNNIVKSASERHLPEGMVDEIKEQNNDPVIVLSAEVNHPKKTSQESAEFLVPVDFVKKAQNQPIEALAALVGSASQIRDFANGKHLVTPVSNIYARSVATEAHFLKETVKRYGEMDLSPRLRKSLGRYPNGLEDLPSLRYRGIKGNEFLNRKNN